MNKTLNKKRTNQKYTIEEVRDIFTDRGYTLLSTEYKSNRIPLDYKCPEGHVGKLILTNFLSGHRCRKCAYIKNGDIFRKPFEEVKQAFTDSGYTLLSTEYKSIKIPLDYRCPEGHLGKIRLDDFSSGHGCRKCADIKNGDRCRKPFEEVKQAFTERGYELLSTEYINCDTHLEYSCPKRHLGKITFSHFSSGVGCAKCSQSRSEKLTRDIFEKIMSVEFQTVRPDFLKNPKTGRNLELDGYNENLKLAFEYNGEQHYKFLKYFHDTEEDFKIQREHDEFKYKKCLELGITLISIPYTFDCYNPEKLEIFIKDELIKHKFIFIV